MTALAHTKPTPSRDNGDSGEGSGESVLLSTAQLATPPDLVQLPLDDEDRAAWAAELGARWRWREFAAHLRFYYTTFGHGLMSQYNPVLWSDGKFHAFHTKAGMAGVDGFCLFCVSSLSPLCLLCVPSVF